MSFAINIVISLIIITVIVIGIYNYLPQIDKLLQDKLNLSLFGKSKNHGLLSQIFYKYNHKDSRAWTEWVASQDAETLKAAKEQLVKHIDNSPSTWGSITNEAIMAYAALAEEDLKVLKDTLAISKKLWKQYKVIDSCYEATLKGIIVANVETAKMIFKEEIEKVKDEAQAICIVHALKDFPEDVDISLLYVNFLSDDNIGFTVKNQAIVSISERGEDAHHIFLETVKTFLAKQGVVSSDNHKIFEQLLAHATKEIDQEIFDLLLAACDHPSLYFTSLKTVDLILRSSYSKFEPKQLYMLVNLAKDEKELLPLAMANVFKLTIDEKVLTRYDDPLKNSTFKKAPVADEYSNKTIELPRALQLYYEKFKEIVRLRAMGKQNNQPGGVVLTGYSDIEKLMLARIFASEKRWHFVYGSFEDLMGSQSTAKTLIDKVATSKPCVLYLDEVESLLKAKDAPFLKSLKQIVADPLVYVLGTLKDDADIDDNNVSVLLKGKDEALSIFPAAMSVSFLTDAQKNTLLTEKTSKLDLNRQAQGIEQLKILAPTDRMTGFEFEKYLTKYFRASLLVHGQLINSSDFEKLDALDFDGRGNL